LINIEPIGEKSSFSIVHIPSNDFFLDSNILFKNELHTSHREIFFRHPCQIFQRFSLMDSYHFIPSFIQMLKYHLNTPFHSSKHLLPQHDGDLVVTQQVKFKPSLGHFDKSVLSPIIHIEACEFLSHNPLNFSKTFFYQGCFPKITFTTKGTSFVTSFPFENILSEANQEFFSNT